MDSRFVIINNKLMQFANENSMKQKRDRSMLKQEYNPN